MIPIRESYLVTSVVLPEKETPFSASSLSHQHDHDLKNKRSTDERPQRKLFLRRTPPLSLCSQGIPAGSLLCPPIMKRQCEMSRSFRASLKYKSSISILASERCQDRLEPQVREFYLNFLRSMARALHLLSHFCCFWICRAAGVA